RSRRPGRCTTESRRRRSCRARSCHAASSARGWPARSTSAESLPPLPRLLRPAALLLLHVLLIDVDLRILAQSRQQRRAQIARFLLAHHVAVGRAVLGEVLRVHLLLLRHLQRHRAVVHDNRAGELAYRRVERRLDQRRRVAAEAADESEARHRAVRGGEAELLRRLVAVRGRQPLRQGILRRLPVLLHARVRFHAAADLIERGHAGGANTIEIRKRWTAWRAAALVTNISLLRAERPLRERRVVAEAGDRFVLGEPLRVVG